MKKLIFITVILAVWSASAFAQDSTAISKNIPFEKKSFPPKKSDALKEAKKNIRLGDGLIEIDNDYKQALRHYLKALRFNPVNSELQFKTGKCFMLGQSSDLENAIKHLNKAASIHPVYTSEVFLYLGRSYHLSEKWDKAILNYNQYLETVDSSAVSTLKNIDQKIEACKHGKQLSEKTDSSIFVKSMGIQFNAKSPSFGAIAHPNGLNLFYTSRKKVRNEFDTDTDGFHYESIYLSSRSSQSDTWKRGKPLGEEFNTKGHEAIVGISLSGKTALIYKGDNNGSIYFSKRVKSKKLKFTKAVKLPKPINSRFRETSATFSADGKTLFFTSDRPSSKGGLDIFYSQRIDGKWQEPINMEVLNTPFDEEGVFMGKDGKTLYFSSKGHNAIGGYDIFTSEFKEGKWSAPKNMGLPINTPFNEVYVSATNNVLYFSSDRSREIDVLGLYTAQILEDIKEPSLVAASPIHFETEEEKPTEKNKKEQVKESFDFQQIPLYSLNLTTVKGKIIDSDTNQPLEAKVILSNNHTQEIKGEFIADKNGIFTIVVPQNENYGIQITKQGYLLSSSHIQSESSMIEKTFQLQPIEKGRKIVLENMFFRSGDDRLSKESKVELNEVAKFLIENKKLQIEISGHTDNTGSIRKNEQLSHQRAKAVVEYLAAQGVHRLRMKYYGYADTKPIADNGTEEGRRKNRRTELKIIK